MVFWPGTLKAADGREIIIAVNETDADQSAVITLPQGSGNNYKNTANGQIINLKTTQLALKANEGVFLVDPI